LRRAARPPVLLPRSDPVARIARIDTDRRLHLGIQVQRAADAAAAEDERRGSADRLLLAGGLRGEAPNAARAQSRMRGNDDRARAARERVLRGVSGPREHQQNACDSRTHDDARPQPLTHTTCRNVCTTSTRSLWFAITSSMGLYAPGISSTTPASLRHSTPAVCRRTSSSE